jgi:exodeoxyribonuclease VII large subunit
MRLAAAAEKALERRKTRLAAASRALATVRPLATLERGYAIVTREPDGPLVRRADQVAVGDEVRARLAQGALVCRVEAKT